MLTAVFLANVKCFENIIPNAFSIGWNISSLSICESSFVFTILVIHLEHLHGWDHHRWRIAKFLKSSLDFSSSLNLKKPQHYIGKYLKVFCYTQILFFLSSFSTTFCVDCFHHLRHQKQNLDLLIEKKHINHLKGLIMIAT